MLTTRHWAVALGILLLVAWLVGLHLPVGAAPPAPPATVRPAQAVAALTAQPRPAVPLATTGDLADEPTAAHPDDPDGTPHLVAVGVSPGATGLGATVLLTYTISSPTAMQYLLGASIALSGTGNWLNDTPHDLIVSAPAGTSTVSRQFLISPYTAVGVYDIQWGLWNASHTTLHDYRQVNAVLTIAAPHLGAVSFSPPSARPGETLVFTYTIESPAAVDYVVGASIALPPGPWISDPLNDPVVSVLTGTTTVSRVFLIPLGAAPGVYNVAWGLWDATHTVRHSYAQEDGVLTMLLNTPTPTHSPTVTRTPTPTRSPTPTASPTVCSLLFEDVLADNVFYAYVRCLSCRGIVTGYPCGGPNEPCPGSYFHPGSYVTRGQVSKIVANAAGFDNLIPSTQQTFQDVLYSNPFHTWVERIAERGYISGYPCGGPGEPCGEPISLPYFRPNIEVTRGQLAKIVSNVAQFTETPTGQMFEDAPPNSTFYLWVQRVAARSIINGYPCGEINEPCLEPLNRPYYRPTSPMTRGQTSKIVVNTFLPSCYTPLRH